MQEFLIESTALVMQMSLINREQFPQTCIMRLVRREEGTRSNLFYCIYQNLEYIIIILIAFLIHAWVLFQYLDYTFIESSDSIGQLRVSYFTQYPSFMTTGTKCRGFYLVLVPAVLLSTHRQAKKNKEKQFASDYPLPTLRGKPSLVLELVN